MTTKKEFDIRHLILFQNVTIVSLIKSYQQAEVMFLDKTPLPNKLWSYFKTQYINFKKQTFKFDEMSDQALKKKSLVIELIVKTLKLKATTQICLFVVASTDDVI